MPEEIAGADEGLMEEAEVEVAEALSPLIELFSQITEVLQSQEVMREVVSVLIIRLAEAVLDLQIRSGLVEQAAKLGDAFGMATAVLNARQATLAEKGGEEE